MLNWRTLGFGLTLASIDVVMMPMVKAITYGWPIQLLIFPILVYAMDPILFYFALKSEGMVLMNLTWNMISNMIVTLTGVFVFRETIPGLKGFGIVLGFLALFCMTYEGDAVFFKK